MIDFGGTKGLKDHILWLYSIFTTGTITHMLLMSNFSKPVIYDFQMLTKDLKLTINNSRLCLDL